MAPTGTVTFLFTDIENSTRLALEHPNTFQSALEIHHDILRKAIESNNGFVFEIIGDAFCCAFEKAEDAVKAAVDAQADLSKQNWQDAGIKIQIGIHTGYAEWNEKKYLGYLTLAKTARVMSAAYGEQILISNEVYEITRDKFDAVKEKDISFRDLGERRLKDMNYPVRLFQILFDELRSEFPPLKTLDARPNNLPVQLTNFIGREEELKHSKRLLKDTRLLTLTGSGGAGKTRFSLQAGADLIDDFENGVWLAELAAVSDPDTLDIVLMNALGLKEEPNKTPEDILTDHLKDKELLIILDNCEHLIIACAELTERLLSACPRLKIIATSREALNCSGEQTYRIPPLSQPDLNSNDTPEDLMRYESVRLFIERAIAVNPKFRVTNSNAPAMAGICSRLDGIPLALELAAARTKSLSVERIYQKLDDRFNLLTGGRRTSLPRQQTLKALIDWSYDLLTEKEKILLSRLSVFSGGWALESAEEICSDEMINKNEILDLLGHLTEKSIIIYDEPEERYRILETIKQYGCEKLTAGNNIYTKYLNYFLELSEKAEPEFQAGDTKIWLDKIETDHKNIQSAIEWAVRNNNTEKAALAAAAIGRFWNTRGYYSQD